MTENEDAENVEQWLLQGKFEPQSSLVRQVCRSDLLQRLNASLAGTLTLIVTPAGYGKSTLLSQWSESLKQSGHLVSWLNTDESDRDPHQFLSHLILSLGHCGVAVGMLEKLASQGLIEVNVDAAIKSLVGVLQKEPSPLVVIVDDYHRVAGPATDQVMEELLGILPDSVHVAVSARSKPRFRYSALMVKGLVQQFSVEDLRLNAAEAREIFPMGCDEKELHTLMERTEGWAMALQLARSLLRDEASLADVLRDLSGGTGDIADYFTQQVYEDLPEDIRRVLRRTSIVERFNADLANCLSERIDCLDVLERLKQQHSLIISTEQGPVWYRYHHLFAEFLRNALGRTEPDSLGALHLQAAQWYEAHDLPAQATKYACLSGHLEYAARIAEQAGGWELILFGGISLFRQLIGHFPTGDLVRFPRLEVARVYQLIKEGQIPQAHQLFARLKEENNGLLADRTNATAPLRRDMVLMGVILDVYEDRITEHSGLQELLAMEESLASSDSTGRALLYAGAAVSALSVGAFNDALRHAKLSQRHMREVNCVLGLNYAMLHEGQANLFLGHLKEAIAVLDDARDMAEDNFGADSGLKAISDILSAAAHYLLGEADSENLNAALEYAEHYDGWFEIYAAGYGTAASLAYARSGLKAALAVLASGRRTAEARGLDRLMELLNAYEYLFLVKEMDLKTAKRFALRTRLSLFSEVKDRHQKNWHRDHLVGLAEGLAALTRGSLQDAHRIADLLKKLAALTGNRWHALDADVLKALAFDSGGSDDKALKLVTSAMDLAVAEGTIQPLLDFGKPLEKLLARIYRHRRDLQISRLTRRFLATCLPQFKRSGENPNQLTALEGPLSQREQEVLEGVAQGLSNKGIARALDMTENTVKFHLKNIFIKLDANNRVTAVSAGRSHGLIA